MRIRTQKTPKKERLSVSVSRDTVKFLKATRTQTNSPSMSAALEKVVADLQSRIEQEMYNSQLRAYYDSLTAAQIQEDSQWGAVGEAVLVSEEEQRPAEPVVAR